MARGRQGVPSSIGRFIQCSKLPRERLAEPGKAHVRAMPQKGMRKQERQTCATRCEKNACDLLELLLG